MWKVLKRTWKGTPLGSSELYQLTMELLPWTW